MRAKYECPFTGKGTSNGEDHESCPNPCHEPGKCCATCCRNCQAICLVPGATNDIETILRPVIVRTR